MSQFVIFVTLTLEPGTQEKFLPIIRENAAASVNNEPGCQRFDVLLPREDGQENTIYLYEAYDDETAFAAHQASPHFNQFKETGSTMVANMEIIKMTI